MFPPGSFNHGYFRRTDQRHTHHTGLRSIARELYRSWEIIVEHRVVGTTMRREQFSARISDTTARREENLCGFSSKSAALEAARRRVDFIRDIVKPNARRQRPRVMPGNLPNVHSGSHEKRSKSLIGGGKKKPFQVSIALHITENQRFFPCPLDERAYSSPVSASCSETRPSFV